MDRLNKKRTTGKNVNVKKITAKRILMLLAAICILAGSFGQAANVSAASTSQKLDQKVTKLVNKKVKSSDSTKKKLKKLFDYVEKSYDYGRKVGFSAYAGWEKDYALEMINDKKGSCYHYAALYAFLAKKAAGCEVRIGIGQTNGFSGSLQAHAWTEVNVNGTWYVCDTNMDKFAADSSKKYFYKKRDNIGKTYNDFSGVTYVTAAF